MLLYTVFFSFQNKKTSTHNRTKSKNFKPPITADRKSAFPLTAEYRSGLLEISAVSSGVIPIFCVSRACTALGSLKNAFLKTAVSVLAFKVFLLT